MGDQTDEAIIQRVLAGHIQDFRIIIEKHSHMAYRSAFSITNNHEDAQEIVQDAFMKAFSALSTFQGRSKFSTWLFRIVYHKALNHLEKTRNYKTITDLENIVDSEYPLNEDHWKRLVNRDQTKFLGLALSQLIPEDRLALSLYYLEEKDQKEISEITGWNLSATKVRIHRARTKLSREIEKILDTEKDSLL
jgi:RNA polymerase sigma-70 factor (ECF subfamily)